MCNITTNCLFVFLLLVLFCFSLQFLMEVSNEGGEKGFFKKCAQCLERLNSLEWREVPEEKLTALASTQGSGNTWVRHLLHLGNFEENIIIC